jgi:hypothetical protein
MESNRLENVILSWMSRNLINTCNLIIDEVESDQNMESD